MRSDDQTGFRENLSEARQWHLLEVDHLGEDLVCSEKVHERLGVSLKDVMWRAGTDSDQAPTACSLSALRMTRLSLRFVTSTYSSSIE